MGFAFLQIGLRGDTIMTIVLLQSHDVESIHSEIDSGLLYTLVSSFVSLE